MKGACEHRMVDSSAQISNPRVAGSSPAAPTTLSFNILNADGFANLGFNFPVTELFCHYKGEIYRVKVDTAALPAILAVSTRWCIANFYPKKTNKRQRLYAYISRYVPGYKRRMTYLHRLVSGAPAGTEVDHRNHNSLDNRRCNLRVGTHEQNMQNRVDCQVKLLAEKANSPVEQRSASVAETGADSLGSGRLLPSDVRGMNQ